MALPKNATYIHRVESDSYPGRVYVFRPALVTDKPELGARRVESSSMSEELRRTMNTHRLTIDFSSDFSQEECAMIREASIKLNDEDGEPLNDEEINILAKSERSAAIRDPEYRQMLKEVQEWRTEGNVKSIAYLFLYMEDGPDDDRQKHKPDSTAETEKWLKTLLGNDLDKLIMASIDMSTLTEVDEKNFEPQPTSV